MEEIKVSSIDIVCNDICHKLEITKIVYNEEDIDYFIGFNATIKEGLSIFGLIKERLKLAYKILFKNEIIYHDIFITKDKLIKLNREITTFLEDNNEEDIPDFW